MLVIPDYEELSSSWGVEGKPIFRGGYWCMPLGWEEQLTILGGRHHWIFNRGYN